MLKLSCVLQRARPLMLKSVSSISHSKVLLSVSSSPLYNKLQTRTDRALKKPPPIDPDYKIIYKYPGIEIVRSISRMKLHSLLTVILATPAAYVLEFNGIIEPKVALSVFVLATSLTASFATVGLIINKFVGIVYYNSKKDIVKIASLSYTGKRVDDYVPRNQLTSVKTFKLFPILSIFTDTLTQKTFRIISQNGVQDALTFNSIFNRDDGMSEANKSETSPTINENVDFESLIKKIQADNKKKAQEENVKEDKKN